MSVRSGALNLLKTNSHEEQAADIKRALKKSDILSLSEVRGKAVQQWAEENGYGYVAGPGDAAILFKPDVIRLVPGTEGSEKLNDLEGERGAARTRHAAYAQFELVSNGKKFWQISAHTVPPGKKRNARREAIEKEQYQTLAKLAKRLDGPVLVSGDLNDRNPNIKGFESGHDGGIMHVMGHGASTVDLDKIADGRLNSDHSAAFSTYRLDGGGKDKINLGEVDGMGKDGGAGRRRRNKGGPKTDDNKVADFAADYGWAKSFIEDNPQLSQVFNQAIENSWSPQRFIAEIQDTPWFKKHSDTWRQSEYLAATDPQTYQQRVHQVRGQLGDAAGKLGIEVSTDLLNKWAERAIKFGWTDSQINNHLARQVKIMGDDSTTFGGDLATTQTNLMSFARDNGVRINDKTMQTWLRQIVRGEATQQEFQQYITKMAVAAHPNWKKELEAGMTLARVAEPYKQTMAQFLEIDPAQIDPNDKMIRRAMSYKDDKGEWKSMSMYDFEDAMRADPRWQKTDNAKKQYMDTGSAILKMFGVST